MPRNLARAILIVLLATGCVTSRHPEVVTASSAGATSTWDEILAGPGVIEHEAVVSGRWVADLSGLVNLDHPAAEALVDAPTPIVLPVHVLRHPEHGVFVIDTGVHRGLVSGERRIVKGLVARALSDVEEVESLASILERQPAPLSGVFVTHLHLDHLLGLPDVPTEVPIYVGPGEQAPKSLMNAALRPTYRRLFGGRPPLQVWQYVDAPAPISGMVDVLGDGSLWALQTPGHTKGSTSFLVLTTEGPQLILGDTSHTWWGWTHGVEPGTFTLDHARNAESIAALRALVDRYPQIRVHVGHEMAPAAGSGAP
jgi:N-acyl homoserine lactone hydrolase